MRRSGDTAAGVKLAAVRPPLVVKGVLDPPRWRREPIRPQLQPGCTTQSRLAFPRLQHIVHAKPCKKMTSPRWPQHVTSQSCGKGMAVGTPEA